MTHHEFEDLQHLLLVEVKGMAKTKGKEYSNNDSDRLANFKRLAIGLGLTSKQVCWVYTKKHLDSIESYCRVNSTYSGESIHGRILDAITYLTLLWGLIQEETNTNQDVVSESQESTP